MRFSMLGSDDPKPATAGPGVWPGTACDDRRNSATTAYAFWICAKRAADSGEPPLWSGWWRLTSSR